MSKPRRSRASVERELRAKRAASTRPASHRPASHRTRVERKKSRLSPMGALVLTAVAVAIGAVAWFHGGDHSADATIPTTPATSSTSPRTLDLDLPCCGREIDGGSVQPPAASDLTGTDAVPGAPAVGGPTATARATTPHATTPARTPARTGAPAPAPIRTVTPAPAAPPAVDPGTADGEDDQQQLDSERIGSYRCADPTQVVIAVNPDVCGDPSEIGR